MEPRPTAPINLTAQSLDLFHGGDKRRRAELADVDGRRPHRNVSLFMAAKLKAYPYQDGFEIAGNRDGLRELARVCLALAELPEDDEQAKRSGNHYHFAEYMNNADEGSVPFVVLYKPSM